MNALRGILAPKPKPKRAAPPIEYSLLLTATLCLLALGAVMVFSASSATSLLSEHGSGDGAEYLKRTLMFGAIGLLVMRVASVRGAQAARSITPLMVGVSLFLLFVVLIPGVGQTVNGSQRWLGTGPLQFQPSEIAKVTLILYGAHLLAARPKRIRSLQGMGPLLLVTGTSLLLIAMQPDLGTAMVVTFSITCLLLTAGVHPRTLLPIAVVAGVAILGIIATNPYQQERLTGFLNPGHDPSGAGFQGTQASIALGSGGVFGVGLGESVQKAFYLPEAHTDMIAAVLGEETGFAGMFVLISLFAMFGYAGFRAAHRARDRYGKLLAAGLTSMILAQATINLFAVMGLAPLTGVPLPFVSYGGTSLVVTLAAAGLILNVARRPAAAGARETATKSRRSRPQGGAGKLRVLEGGGETRRRRAGTGTSGDSGRRHSGSRGSGDRGRRRAAR